MAWVETRITRTTQPQDVGVGIDWNNPVTQGLLGSWNGALRGKATHGTDALPQGDAVAKVGRDGLGLSNASTGSNNYWRVERGTRYTYTQQVTFEALVEVDVFTNVAPFISGVVAQYVQPGSSADDRGPFLRFGNGVSGNHDRPFFAVMQSNTERGVLGPSLQTGRKYHLFGTYDGATVKLFIDGVLIGTNAVTGSFENGANAYVALGTDYPGVSTSEFRALQGRIYLANVYNVGKTDAQAKSLADNPWQIFASDPKALWTPAAVSVTLPTLVQPTSTTSAGAWTATGAATLHAAINELVPSSAQYISVNSASPYTFRFAEAAYPGTANQAVSYRASSLEGSTLTIRLFQGATTIMERTHSLTSTYTLYTQTLTAGEIALITAGPIDGTLTTS